MKTSRVRRIIEIITALQSAQHYAACDLAKIFGTSRRTIFRDLRDLQEVGVCFSHHLMSLGNDIFVWFESIVAQLHIHDLRRRQT